MLFTNDDSLWIIFVWYPLFIVHHSEFKEKKNSNRTTHFLLWKKQTRWNEDITYNYLILILTATQACTHQQKFYCFNASTILLPLFCVWFAVYYLLIDPHIILFNTENRQNRSVHKLIDHGSQYAYLLIRFFLSLCFSLDTNERERKKMRNQQLSIINVCWLLMFNESMRTKSDFENFRFFRWLRNFVCVIIIGGYLIDRWTNCWSSEAKWTSSIYSATAI